MFDLFDDMRIGVVKPEAPSFAGVLLLQRMASILRMALFAAGGIWAVVAAGQSTYTPYVISTYAGQGDIGTADGTGSAARFYFPQGVAVDGSSNIYVADTSNHTIRKIAPGGIVTTLAGSPGNSGSTDGTGSAARFTFPNDVALDASGNIYVADSGNHTIRKITPGGVVTTLAGLAGSYGSANGTGSAARFYFPQGVAVDASGNVYVTDSDNYTIRKVTLGGVVTTLAGLAGSYGSTDGTGSAARFYFPQGVAVDADGNVYVADSWNNTVRKVTSGGVVTTLAGLAGSYGSADGTGSAARFNFTGLCGSVAVDASGNVYVAEYGNDTIRKITPGGMVTTLAGLAGSYGNTDGTGSAAQFSGPDAVAVGVDGKLYIADRENNEIRMGVLSASVPALPRWTWAAAVLGTFAVFALFLKRSRQVG